MAFSTNATAFAGPYVDQARTKRNPPAQTITPTPTPTNSGNTGEITVYEPDGTNHEPGVQAGTPVHSHAPNRWRRGRDMYANNGTVGQNQLKHVSQQ